VKHEWSPWSSECFRRTSLCSFQAEQILQVTLRMRQSEFERETARKKTL
jgi:hypothetical protein